MGRSPRPARREADIMSPALDLASVDPERRAAVAVDQITVERKRWVRHNRRPPAFTARQALAALRFECLLVWTAAHNLVNGVALTSEDLDRLMLAQRRIDAIASEVTP
jgi:hypothetical protein